MKNEQKKHIDLLERSVAVENLGATVLQSMLPGLDDSLYAPAQGMRHLDSGFRGQLVRKLKAQVEAGTYQMHSDRLAHHLWHSTTPNHLLKFDPGIVMDE